MREREHLERVAELARPFYGDDVKLKIEPLRPDSDEQAGKTNGAAKNKYDVRQEAMNHPVLQKVIDLFEGAEVREIIPRRNN